MLCNIITKIIAINRNYLNIASSKTTCARSHYLLVELFNGATNFDGRCSLKNPGGPADSQVHFRVDIRLIVRLSVQTGNYRRHAHVRVVASSGVAGLLTLRFLRRAFAFFATLFATLRHYLFADNLAPLHATAARLRTLKLPNYFTFSKFRKLLERIKLFDIVLLKVN